MKTFRKALSIFLCILTVFSCTAFAFAAPETADTASVALTDEDYLVVKGRTLYNKKGEHVQLKGVNLGAWLTREDWLCPDHIPEGEQYDGEYIYDTLEERFGREKAKELMDMYYENWITEWDLDNIKAKGFNCVRVPFWY